MELLCPCGKGKLVRAVTKNGLNKNRPYYKCPSSRYGAVDDCKFYSFEDELQQCPCGRGLCRTKFKRKEKFWCCPVQGDGACEFWMPITTTTNGYGHPSTSDESSPTNNPGHVTGELQRINKMLAQCLEVSHASSGAYLDIIRNFANVGIGKKGSGEE